ncbi:MAG: selenocysteine-specific translation elongation factor [Desulfobacteraceae bacterium]|nr:selenocysteine-specific translation elongation factor [Desulfobacteraceae bacterium]MBC2754196.1 selenocysteine-specific translation elongation factor [Desulfobacteraceae bacterium]
MKQIILGTAGHIDHGKTSLIKAISGYDTDRLKEEKQRGITIELGFASLDLPSGTHIGIVDVPGHEKFVKNMVAGATGIDVVAMIIAADEGVMPQTREHLEICTLLGIQYGFIVLTKIDMVDNEWAELVKEDLAEFVEGTFLENAPVIPVSSVTGEGIPEFIQALDSFCSKISVKKPSGLFRLPVDRVFTMKGFGTVITGTLISGKISVGETVMIYPGDTKSKIRGLQVHDQQVNTAEAGMRTAINFQGIEKATVNRGDMIARLETLKNSFMLDIELHLLESNVRPVKNRDRVRFHTGTSELPCNVILLDRETLEPGKTAVIQLRLDAPVACVKDDRFVIRSYSPVRTLGGGRILNPIPKKHKRFKDETNVDLYALANADEETLIQLHAKDAGYAEVAYSDLPIVTNLSGKQLDKYLKLLLSKQLLIQTDKENKRYIHQKTFETFMSKISELLTQYHSAHPLKSGMPKGELKSKFPPIMSDKLFNHLLNAMVKSNEIVLTENNIRLPGHKVTLKADQSGIKKKIIETYLNSGLQPPYFKELSGTLKIDPRESKNVLMLLVKEGSIVKVKEELFFHADVITDLKTRLMDFLKSNSEITTPKFKEMTGASRKYTIPLLEYFDDENLTIRVGDIRQLRKQ